MSRIRGKENVTTELRLISLFRSFKITGWRRNARLTGRPDFIFPKEKVTIFVDGCFWHGCPFCGKRAKSNLSYWQPKIAKNKTRDRRVSRILRSEGWAVIRIWECKLRKPDAAIARIERKLTSKKYSHSPKNDLSSRKK